ncbi:transmembrane protein 247 [Dugong dugon]
MTTEDREVMEARGAGESCPSFPKMAPGDPIAEGKSKASLEADPPKPDSSYEEMETCEEERGCQGPPKPLPLKAGPTTKGQAGDGPQLAEPPPEPEPGTKRPVEIELEKMRMEFELTRLKYVHEENQRQRQHEEVMEQLQQQAAPRLFSGGLQDLLLPQNQFAMFLYCFIFIHIVYVTKEMIVFLFSKHYLFCIAAILLYLIKTLWPYFQVPLVSPSLGIPILGPYSGYSGSWTLLPKRPKLMSKACRASSPGLSSQGYTALLNVIESNQQGIAAEEAHEKHLRAGLEYWSTPLLFFIYPECPRALGAPVPVPLGTENLQDTWSLAAKESPSH